MPDTVDQFEFECAPENAHLFWKWVQKRGGIAKWRSIDMSDPGRTWSTPVNGPDGQKAAKPHPWKSDSEPYSFCSDPEQIKVITDKEVQRFHVAVRRGGNGLSFKLTDNSSARVRKTHAKWCEQNEGAAYHFDYETQEAVFTIPDEVITLNEWARRNPQLAEQALNAS